MHGVRMRHLLSADTKAKGLERLGGSTVKVSELRQDRRCKSNPFCAVVECPGILYPAALDRSNAVASVLHGRSAIVLLGQNRVERRPNA